jgi:hypothetical protein
MKQKVINWLRSGCPWKEGLILLPMDGILYNLHRTCSLQGPTKSNREMLEYQLCKYVGISEKETAVIKKQKQAVKASPAVFKPLPAVTEKNISKVKVSEPVIAKSAEPVKAKPVAPEIKKTIPVPPEAPVVKLREEYPFLNDPKCPDELKILVADKITAHKNYCDAHSQLSGCTNDEDLFLTSRDVVENYLDNKLIFEELNHYKKTGKLLMEHPIFEDRKRDAEIKQLNISELIKLKKNLEMNIWRNENKIKKDTGSPSTFSRQQTVQKYKRELKLVISLFPE